MLIRIVKMTFHPENTAQFRSVFEMNKELIAGFEGCKHLELWQDKNDSRIFFTYSHWESAMALERYRQSDLFQSVWGKTKILFAEKPEAWTIERQD